MHIAMDSKLRQTNFSTIKLCRRFDSNRIAPLTKFVMIFVKYFPNGRQIETNRIGLVLKICFSSFSFCLRDRWLELCVVMQTTSKHFSFPSIFTRPHICQRAHKHTHTLTQIHTHIDTNTHTKTSIYTEHRNKRSIHRQSPNRTQLPFDETSIGRKLKSCNVDTAIHQADWLI